MKLFLACSDRNNLHKEMAPHAINSAIVNTDFEIVFMYDGADEIFVKKLAEKGVKVERSRSRFYEYWGEKGEGWRGIASGAYLRLEIPEVCKRNNFSDEFVLYTDCDVIFLKQPDFSSYSPKYFAASTESNRAGLILENMYPNMNSGVMLINVNGMGSSLNKFSEFCINNKFDFKAVDQGALMEFYKNQWDFLAEEYNWKTYWGINKNAFIIHYHGPKAKHMQNSLLGENIPANKNPSILNKFLIKLTKLEITYFINLYKKYSNKNVDLNNKRLINTNLSEEPLLGGLEKFAGFKYYLSLCSAIKNEAPYLLEWIEYHRMVGVEHFYIYDNNSSDFPKEILQSYIDSGVVTFFDWPKHPGGQMSAFNDCLTNFKNETFWLGLIDIDEFIVPLSKNTLSDFMKEYEESNGLGINWIVYGSSGHKKKPEGLVIENFLYRSNQTLSHNNQTKVIVNPRKVKIMPNQHYCVFNGDPAVGVLDENKQILFPKATSPKNSTSKIRINHYFTKSYEEWEKKRVRGRTGGAIRPERDFANLDRNDVRDELMLSYANEIKKRIEVVKKSVSRQKRIISVLKNSLQSNKNNARNILRRFADYNSLFNSPEHFEKKYCVVEKSFSEKLVKLNSSEKALLCDVTKKVFYPESKNKVLQPFPYYVIIMEKGSVVFQDNNYDFTFDKKGVVIEEASGERTSFYKRGDLGKLSIGGVIEISGKNLLHISLANQYWHLHNETFAQMIMYDSFKLFDELNPKNTVILFSWGRGASRTFYDAVDLIFKKNLEKFQIIFAEKNFLYKTDKKIYTTTLTSTAGCLPLPFTAKYVNKRVEKNPVPHEFIYISRDDSDHRKLLNQEEVLNYLLGKGISFKKYELSGISFKDQVGIFKNAKCVMLISGSSSTNLVYCNPEKTSVVYLSPHSFINSSKDPAEQLKMKFCIIRSNEEFTPKTTANTLKITRSENQNFKLNPEEVYEEIKKIL